MVPQNISLLKKPSKWVLIGYMGSGKTLIGRNLSLRLSVPFYDLDEEIEKEEGMSIDDIFTHKGDLYFRKCERKLLLKFLNYNEKLILSTGGGTPCYFDNMDLLLQHAYPVVYLKSSIPVLSSRLWTQKHQRPLISQISSFDLLKEYVAKHLFERSTYYEKASISLNTDDKTLKEIVEELGTITI